MTRGGRKDLHGDWTERNRRQAVVKAHIEAHGMWCPGYHVPAHPSLDLCADHVVGVGAGGDPGGALGVLCRSCNSRRGKGDKDSSVWVPSVRSRDWL